MDLRISELTNKLMEGLQRLNDLNEIVSEGIETLYGEDVQFSEDFAKAERAYRDILLKLVIGNIEDKSNNRNITEI